MLILASASPRRQELLRLITDDVPGDICEEGSDLKAILDGFISVGVVRNIG